MTSVPEALSHKFKNMAFLCAMLIALIHVGLGSPEAGSVLWAFKMLIPWGIAQIGVPFFFLSSGYFLAGHIGEDGWWKREVLKRVRTLLIPFFIWNVAFLFFDSAPSIVADWVAHRPFGTNAAFLHRPILSSLGFYPSASPVLYVTWYIRTLFLLVLATPAIVWVLRRCPWLLILGAWLISIPVCTNESSMQDFQFCFSPEGLAYFSLGLFLRWHPIHVEERKLWAWSVIIALVLLALRMGRSYTTGSLEVYLKTFSIPFMLYAVWGLIPAKPWAKGLTSLAFACYLIHVFVTRVLHIGISAIVEDLGFFPNAPKSLEAWISIVLTVPVTLILGYALHRWFPRVAGVLFGGR